MAKTPAKPGEPAGKKPVAKASSTKPGGGIHAPVKPSPELAAIVGAGDMPRSEIVSKLWEYIKKNNLQDAKDKRQINADAKLEKVFGKKSVSMFEMNKHVSSHVK